MEEKKDRIYFDITAGLILFVIGGLSAFTVPGPKVHNTDVKWNITCEEAKEAAISVIEQQDTVIDRLAMNYAECLASLEEDAGL